MVEATRWWNTEWPLAHLLDCTERQVVVNRTKHCSRCEQDLPLESFYPSQRTRNSSYCKRCSVAWQKERYRGRRGIPLDDSDLRLRQGEDHHFWRGRAATYNTVHTRLHFERGSASAYVCSCGKPAAHWAYDHVADDERISERGYAYTTDLTHYAPMCRSCHRRMDMAHRRARPAG